MTSPDEELFTVEVGLVEGGQRLTCCINLHEKSLRYYKSRRVLLAFNPALRLKRWAFHRLRAHARPHPAATHDPPFLPGELLRGNPRAIPAFLHQLRGQKVESFIPLRFPIRQEEPRGGRLAVCLMKILQAVRSECFRRVRGKEEKGRDAESQEGRKGRRGADTTVPGGTNRSADSTPPARTSRSLSVTYTRLALPASRNPPRPDSRSLQKAIHRPSPAVSIRRLEQSSPGKVYTFEAGERRWERRAPAKTSSFRF